MWQHILDWLDERIGYRQLKQNLFPLGVAGCAQMPYLWGSILAFFFTLQVITGILLMTAYSPSSTTAWGSVYFIQYEMDFGWLIRGIHYYAAQAMLVLLGVYIVHLVLVKMHLPPGEVLWWAVLLLLGVTMATDLTGNPLPWDQKGFWALQVELNIISAIPGLGPMLQRWILGGPEAGHLTLARLYALHVVVLPTLLAFLLLAERVLAQRYRRRVVGTMTLNIQQEDSLRMRRAFVRLALAGILLGLCLWPRAHPIADNTTDTNHVHRQNETSWWASALHAGRYGLGAPLDSPADPSREYAIARPKWTYWFLFQMRKSLEGSFASQVTVLGPLLVGLVLMFLPLLARGRLRSWVYGLSVALVLILALAVIALTGLAWWNDYGDSPTAQAFQAELHQQQALARRAVQLASRGIPVEGAVELLRRDPQTRGKELYQQHCATCHGFGTTLKPKASEAPDLQGFGTQDWIYQLLQRMRDESSLESRLMPQMAGWLRREYERAQRADDRARKAGETPTAVADLERDLYRIAAWLATHPRRPVPQEGPERELFEKDTSAFAEGYRAYEGRCLRCHTYVGTGGGDTNGPDLTGYGDAQWMRELLHAPFDRRYYGPSVVRWSRKPEPRSWMPAFRDRESRQGHLWERDLERTIHELEQMVPEDDPQRDKRLQAVHLACRVIQLTHLERELIIRFVLGDDQLVFDETR